MFSKCCQRIDQLKYFFCELEIQKAYFSIFTLTYSETSFWLKKKRTWKYFAITWHILSTKFRIKWIPNLQYIQKWLFFIIILQCVFNCKVVVTIIIIFLIWFWTSDYIRQEVWLYKSFICLIGLLNKSNKMKFVLKSKHIKFKKKI